MKIYEKHLLIKIATKKEGESVRDVINADELLREKYKKAWYILGKWTKKGWYSYGGNLDLGWLTPEGFKEFKKLEI